MIKVNVIIGNKNWNKYIKQPELYLKKKIKKLYKNNKIFKNKNLEFSILLSDKHEIKKLNKNFRKKDKSTDVLSFPFYEKKEITKFLKKKLIFYLGDIIINLSEIKNKSNTIENKLDEYWIHGLVHLLGGRHEKKKEYLKMKIMEKKFYKSIN
ncbi:rRNA maturation RNase YbeY [Pelagibacteraceae bacterium]|nr:rRNA maturation RNase YbeY [Pelagibacteraceae bacterium]